LRALLAEQRELSEGQRALMTAQGLALAALQESVQASESNICQRLDALTRTTDEDPQTARDFTTRLAAEIDRLDGYLVYQSDETRRAVAAAIDSAPRQIIPAGKDLDAIFASEVFDIVVPTREEGLLAFLSRHGAEAVEPGVRAVLTAHLRPGDVAVDAGASIGLHALGMAAAVGPEGRVVCFEPLPHIAAALKRTLRLNGFAERSEVHMAALSDTSGTADLFAAAHSPLSSLFPLPDAVSDDHMQVSLVTLDDVLPPGSRVDVIKVDVEGAEPRVWRGMRRVRQENQRLAIMLEWSASHFVRSGESPADFMREILADGFNVAAIDDEQPGRVVPVGVEEALNLENGNLILLRDV
jgi:FkbM family methyltransferase